MVRVCGVILAPKKHVNIALRSVYGIGRTRALKICEMAGVNPAEKVTDLPESAFTSIQKAIDELSYEVEGDLRRLVASAIKRLKDIKSYRGLRHRLRLPCRGQRTKTNAKTRKRAGSSSK